MILDLERFVRKEQPRWRELEALLGRLDAEPGTSLDLQSVLRLHHLYQQAGADLAKVKGQSAAPQLRRYLESLVARAYAEIHENRDRRIGFSPRAFFLSAFPRAFRKHIAAFWLSLLVTLAGAAAGGALVRWDADAKPVLLPFEHLMGSPGERVAREEGSGRKPADRPKSYFSSYLMTNNIRVSILTLVTGFAWGLGPLVLLFYNGTVLGAVIYDYLAAGQARFLAGWLLPHGSFEIPAILIAGQAGFLLGVQLLRGARHGGAGRRLRAAAPDAAVLMGGIASMLVWAGIVEAFFSQYHYPILPYWIKITFGCAELTALILYLGWAGRGGGGRHVPR
ncbi:MAG TPA: stage II sporulation protein M [Fibrobacteria bacterium]|nr:stage II sporulation protein M [Fibrobacteria bacterium]